MDALPLTVVASLVTAGLYLHVGRVVRARQVSAEARIARDAFATWWGLLGASSLLGAAQTALYLSGNLPVWLYQTFAQAGLWAIFAALCALQVYLVYLYTGSNRWIVPIGVAYLAFYLVVIGLLHWIGPPDALMDDGWRIRTEPEAQLGRWATLVFLVVLVGPQMLAAILYARLFGKTKDRTQRYRIALLSSSILIWFGTALVVGAASDPDDVNVPWQVVSRLLAIAAAGAILMAYKPPRWVQERFGVESLAGRPTEA